MLSVLGTKTAADGGDVSPKLGRKSKLTQSPMKSEAHAVPVASALGSSRTGTHVCNCGCLLDRDRNAARKILS